jgi:hypothetical protein
VIVDTLHRLHHDSGWTILAAVTLATLGAALTVISLTAWSRPR